MDRKHPGNVTQLSAYRAPKVAPEAPLTDRQMAVREHLIDAAGRSAADAPTALVGLSVQPSGKIQSIALQVEPEHVLPVLTAMRSLMTKLESYLTSSIASRHLLLFSVGAVIQVADLLTVPAMAALVLLK